MRKTLVVAVAFAAIALLAAPSLAKTSRGGGKGSTSADSGALITVDQSSPHYGDFVTFTTSYPATNQTMVVALRCYQDGVLKFQLVGAPDAFFQLAGSDFSTEWTAGAAHCTADLMYYTYRGQILTGAVYVANTAFDVAA